MIIVQISNIRKDPVNVTLRDKWELLINIEGQTEVLLESKLFFSESLLIVEFATELKKWIAKSEGLSFQYETMDDEEKNIFNIIAVSNDQYQFQSVWEEFKSVEIYNRLDVVNFIESYIQQVKDSVQNKLGINLHEKIGLSNYLIGRTIKRTSVRSNVL